MFTNAGCASPRAASNTFMFAEQKVGGGQFSEINRGGFAAKRITPLQMHTTTFRSTARPSDVDPRLARRVQYHVDKQTHFHTNTIHHPHINVCLYVQDTRQHTHDASTLQKSSFASIALRLTIAFESLGVSFAFLVRTSRSMVFVEMDKKKTVVCCSAPCLSVKKMQTGRCQSSQSVCQALFSLEAVRSIVFF